jgi:hypothetical protein
MKTIQTLTALGYATLHCNQAILISTRYRPIQGLLLSPGPKKSLARFMENEKLTEKRVDNHRIFPIQTKKQPQKNKSCPETHGTRQKTNPCLFTASC